MALLPRNNSRGAVPPRGVCWGSLHLAGPAAGFRRNAAPLDVALSVEVCGWLRGEQLLPITRIAQSGGWPSGTQL